MGNIGRYLAGGLNLMSSTIRHAIFAAACCVQPFVATASAQAQIPETLAAPAAASAACELHVWPGHDFHSVYYGWAHGGTVDGAAKGRDGYENVPHEPLSAGEQVKILGSADLAATLSLAGYRTVIHETPLSSREIRTGLARHALDTPRCYAELMIDDLVLQKNFTGTQALNILYRFRQFDGDVSGRSFGTYIQVPVRIADKAIDRSSDAIVSELASAYSISIHDFGKALAAPPKKKR